MPSNSNRAKALLWFQKGLNESDCFTAFIYHWISFNALYNIYPGGEKARIKNFFMAEYNSSFDPVLSVADVTTFQTPIQDLRFQGNGSRSAANDLANTNKSPKNRLVALMKCIYQARCNLFHGEKGANDYRDQEIANAASNVMKEFLTIYFGGQQNGQTSIH